jgi:Peptidase_C39 like family
MNKVSTGRCVAGGVATTALAAGVVAFAVQARPSAVPAQVRAATVAPVVSAVPSAYTVKIVGQYQSKNSWCVPTSSSIRLRTFGISVSQTTLATKMKTTSTGTYAKTAIPALNSYVKSKKRAYRTGDDISSGSKLMTKVAYDVGVLHRATVLGVWIDDLPWSGKGWKDNTGHAIVVYGYNKSKGTITVWDPWKTTNGKKTGGSHVISATKLAAVSQKGGMYYIYGI